MLYSKKAKLKNGVYVQAVKQTRDLMNQPALAEYNAGEKSPGPKYDFLYYFFT